MKFFKLVILIIWQLPQILLGLVFKLFIKVKKQFKYRNSIIYFTDSLKHSGISFGKLIFVSNDMRGEVLISHEYGHSIQSLIFGPLYLIVIGIPSVIRSIIFAYNTKRTNNINEKTKIKADYFKAFPEKRATELGERYYSKVGRVL